MAHPYMEFDNTLLWTALDSAINDLVANKDLSENTARAYIVGYLCQKIHEREGVPSQLKM